MSSGEGRDFERRPQCPQEKGVTSREGRRDVLRRRARLREKAAAMSSGEGRDFDKKAPPRGAPLEGERRAEPGAREPRGSLKEKRGVCTTTDPRHASSPSRPELSRATHTARRARQPSQRPLYDPPCSPSVARSPSFRTASGTQHHHHDGRSTAPPSTAPLRSPSSACSPCPAGCRLRSACPRR